MLHKFQTGFNLSRAIQNFIAIQLTSNDETAKLKQLFLELDQNGDGTLSKEELYEGLKEDMGEILASREIDKVFTEVDADGSGQIEYSEFLVASLHQKVLTKQAKLESAFQAFDQDGSGTISSQELMGFFQGKLNKEQADKLIKDVDVDGDHEINMAEFQNAVMNIQI